MKKIMKSVSVLLSIVIIIMSITSCSIFSNQSDNDSKMNEKTEMPPPQTQTITVYKGETPTNYTVTLGEVAKIDVFMEPGFYFVGAYDSEEGGTKYFDANGNSTLVWGSGNPSTYYARFDNISNVTYTQTLRDEDPYSWHSGLKYFTFEFSESLKNAIKANLDEELLVSVSFSVTRERNWDIGNAYLTNLKTGGEKYVCFETVPLSSSSYKEFSKTFKVKAKLVREGCMYFAIEAPITIIESVDYSIKNITLDIAFVESE